MEPDHREVNHEKDFVSQGKLLPLQDEDPRLSKCQYCASLRFLHLLVLVLVSVPLVWLSLIYLCCHCAGPHGRNEVTNRRTSSGGSSQYYSSRYYKDEEQQRGCV